MTTIADLNQTHLRRKVTITGLDWSITGRLVSVHHDVNIDAVRSHNDEVVREITRPSITVGIGPFEFESEGEEPVEFL